MSLTVSDRIGIRIILSGGASWTSPEEAERIADVLSAASHYGATVDKSDLMAASIVLLTYGHILTHPAGTERIVRQVREARRLVRKGQNGE